MDKGFITVSSNEIYRLKMIHKVMEKELTQVKASEVLGLSERHLRRLVRRVRDGGDRGIVHRSRGRPSPRRMSEELEARIAKITEEEYWDFGPTLASEKLEERHGIRVGREKLRQVMIARGLWRACRRKGRGHQWRERKPYYGEMVQMDGSHHDWLEGRGPKMVFMGYIDDATNHVFGRFYDYEGMYPAMDSFECYIRRYGLPVGLYVDKHSTYKTTRQPSTDELLRDEMAATQFARACRELEVRVIHAHSPQAKGRVEKLFGTLQDRLIKELRLEGISIKDRANEFLKKYLLVYNKKFSKEPPKKGNLHRSLPRGVRLKEIFCFKGTRTITNGYVVKWKGRILLVDSPTIALRRRKVEVREYVDGDISLIFNGHYLKYREVHEQEPAKKKQSTKIPKKKGKYIPPADHPWHRHDPSLHHNCYLESV